LVVLLDLQVKKMVVQVDQEAELVRFAHLVILQEPWDQETHLLYLLHKVVMVEQELLQEELMVELEVEQPL
tara:strand:- start:180 stop:392 length:213 start_codon:yes stop_codon:yes gene_type:complete